MKRTPLKRNSSRIAIVVLLLACSLALVSATKPVWTTLDKAYYADPNLVAFVRPGLEIEIMSAEIAADGTIKARVKFTDPRGLPLDRAGITTPGTISASLIAATIPAGQKQYVAYTTRIQTSPITGVSAVQASGENNGTWTQVSDGVYDYTFRTKAPSGFDQSATHTIGVYANRNLEEFELGVNLKDATFNFVPNGSPVTVVRDVVRTETCNKRCHQGLALHGETGRTTVPDCILCHSPQSIDPDTGNTVDFKVMIHKIHLGEGLPSVEAGTPYRIIGFGQSVHDFSDVVFPADARRCAVCHDLNSGAAQADAWLTAPNREACGACHDHVNFATGEDHAGGPQVSDNLCAGCHIPEGEVEFDASIIGAHTIDREAKSLPGVVIDLIEVSGKAGEHPTVTFTAKDKAGNPLDISKLDRVRLRLIGPTSDYPREADQEDARGAPGGADGRYTYTMQEAIPADATGSWAVGVEARQLVTLQAGTVNEMTDVRDLAFNDVIYFSVDGSEVRPRRTVVSLDNCNACHAKLGLHGGNRNNPEYCVFCHNPNTVGEGETEEVEESIDFPLMIHRIHSGAELQRKYFVGGNDYSHVEYPGKRQNCNGCHTNDSQQLPLNHDLLPVMDPQGWLNPVRPTSGACLACHDSIEAASHALANTTDLLGESCAACHGDGKEFSVNRVHAQ